MSDESVASLSPSRIGSSSRLPATKSVTTIAWGDPVWNSPENRPSTLPILEQISVFAGHDYIRNLKFLDSLAAFRGLMLEDETESEAIKSPEFRVFFASSEIGFLQPGQLDPSHILLVGIFSFGDHPRLRLAFDWRNTVVEMNQGMRSLVEFLRSVDSRTKELPTFALSGDAELLDSFVSMWREDLDDSLFEAAVTIRGRLMCCRQEMLLEPKRPLADEIRDVTTFECWEEEEVPNSVILDRLANGFEDNSVRSVLSMNNTASNSQNGDKMSTVILFASVVPVENSLIVIGLLRDGYTVKEYRRKGLMIWMAYHQALSFFKKFPEGVLLGDCVPASVALTKKLGYQDCDCEHVDMFLKGCTSQA